MRLFIDTGSVAEVEEIAAWGVLSGATTNPSLLAKEESDPGEAIKRMPDSAPLYSWQGHFQFESGAYWDATQSLIKRRQAWGQTAP